MRKSKKERLIEQEWGMPMEEVIPLVLEGRTLEEAAAKLHTTKSTLGHWTMKHGYRFERVLLRFGDRVLILKSGEQACVTGSRAELSGLQLVGQNGASLDAEVKEGVVG